MRVAFTATALADLEEISDYIAMDSPLNAMKYVQELRSKADGIGDYPKMYPIRRGLPGTLRVAPHKSHLILYRIKKSEVEIARFVYGARDLQSLFEP